MGLKGIFKEFYTNRNVVTFPKKYFTSEGKFIFSGLKIEFKLTKSEDKKGRKEPGVEKKLPAKS